MRSKPRWITRTTSNVFNLGIDDYCDINHCVSWITARLGVSPRLTYSGGDRGRWVITHSSTWTRSAFDHLAGSRSRNWRDRIHRRLAQSEQVGVR